MRKLLLTLAALAAFGIVLPAATGSASAETVIIKKHRHWDRGHHYGWYHRHHHHHGAAVVVR